MAFAASQYSSSLLEVPSADPDTDMLSDAAYDGHDFEIDIDAVSVAENQDVDFVLDDETGAETIDEVMLEAAMEQKTFDAAMDEPDLVPDEIMDAGDVLNVPEDDGEVTDRNRASSDVHKANQKTSAVGDGHDTQLASVQQHSAKPKEPTDPASPVPNPAALLDPSSAAAKTDDEDHSLPPTTDAGVEGDSKPESSSTSTGRSDAKDENPPDSKPLSAPNSPLIPSPDRKQSLEIDETTHSDPKPENEHGLESQDDNNEGEYAEPHENVNEEYNTLNESGYSDGSEYAAVVLYAGSKMSLFPPTVEGLPETYLLQDASLAERALHELFIACRHVLGASIGEDCQLQIEISDLRLVLQEDSIECSNITLWQIMEIHDRLSQNDGVESPSPLSLRLLIRPRMTARLRELTEVISASKGYSSFLSAQKQERHDHDFATDQNKPEQQIAPEAYNDQEDDQEDDQAAQNVDTSNNLPSEEDDTNDVDDSVDADELDADDSSAPDLGDSADNQESYEPVNESTTERDTNSERKSATETEDQHESDTGSRPGDAATAGFEDDLIGYSEDEAEYPYNPTHVDAGPHDDMAQSRSAHDRLDTNIKTDAAAPYEEGVGDEFEAASDDGSLEGLNILDAVAGDADDQDQFLLNVEYAEEPKLEQGKSTAEESVVYLHGSLDDNLGITLKEDDDYGTLDDWLAEEENFGLATDSKTDVLDANGSAQLENEDNEADDGAEALGYGEEWGSEVEAGISTASKPVSDSPLGKRTREDSVDVESEPDQEVKRVKSS